MNKTSFTNENPVFSLDGIPNPEWVKVTDITDRLLPVMTVSTTNVSGRVGNVRTGKAINTREIQIAFFIKASNEQQMRERARVLANHFLHATEQVKYINHKEPDGYYMVDIQSGGELREQLMLGRCLITLLATDPHFYSHEDIEISFEESPEEHGVIEIYNKGQATFPIIEFEATRLHVELFVAIHNRFMQFGEDDQGQDTIPREIPVIVDNLTSLANWLPAPSGYDMNIVGEITATPSGFVQLNNHFGPNLDGLWRGSGVRRSLPRTLENWRIQTNFEFFTSRDPSQTPPEAIAMGRIMITALDVEGNHIASVRFENRYSMFFPHFMGSTRIEPSNNLVGWRLARDIVDRQVAPWMNPPLEEPSIAGSRNFEIALERTGTSFFASVRRDDSSGPHWAAGGVEVGLEGPQMNNIAQVQIDIATRGSAGIVNMSVHRIEVSEMPDFEFITPSILDAGDVVEIDSETGLITRNGERWFQDLAPQSQFPILNPGMNQLVFAPSDGIKNVKFKARTRFL